jgi:hypothetical protein
MPPTTYRLTAIFKLTITIETEKPSMEITCSTAMIPAQIAHVMMLMVLGVGTVSRILSIAFSTASVTRMRLL